MLKKLLFDSRTLPVEKQNEAVAALVDYIDRTGDKRHLYHKLDRIVNGGVFTPEAAEHAVSCFENSKDGTKGAHWSRSQTDKILGEIGASYPAANFYVLLNRLYSDHSGSFTDEDIIKMAKDKVRDKDAYPGMLKDEVYGMLDHMS